MRPEALELVAFSAAALIFVVAFAPAAAPRRAILVKGAAGLAGTIAIAVVPTMDLALLVLLTLGVLHAAIEGTRSFVIRVRGPVIAVALVVVALVFLRAQAPSVVARFGAVGLVAGVAAAVGLLPYLHTLDPKEPLTSSPVAWLGFMGPAIASVLVARSQGLLSPDAGAAFGSMLIALGILNMAWGAIASFATAEEIAAWRYSFVADWGLVLCGFGLTIVDAQRGALLMLFSIAVCRLPLYFASRQPIREKKLTRRPINLVVAAALAGSAPFAGFAARILLLRAATQLSWPLALVLAGGMLLWLPGSLRLGRTLAVPGGRQAVGVALVLALNVAAGLYPLPLLTAARL